MPTLKALRLPLLLLAVCAALAVSAVAANPAHGHAKPAACNLCLTAAAPAIAVDAAPAVEPLHRLTWLDSAEPTATPLSPCAAFEAPRGPPVSA